MEFAAAQFADVGGRRLAYEEVRPADPQGSLLLLCGLGAKRQGWYRQLAVLGERFRAIAVDYRDVGGRRRARVDLTGRHARAHAGR